jgi:hypothetical protein
MDNISYEFDRQHQIGTQYEQKLDEFFKTLLFVYPATAEEQRKGGCPVLFRTWEPNGLVDLHGAYARAFARLAFPPPSSQNTQQRLLHPWLACATERVVCDRVSGVSNVD